jgi:hypothetical protein
VVSKLEPRGPGGAFGGVEDGQIADVAMHKGFAYLMSWDDPDCERGGVHVVDATDPARPQEAGFIPAVKPYYHGEGAHAVSLATPAFTGDLLAVNNETYSADCGGEDKTGGGFDLYDVSNPRDPKVLVQVAGDKSPDGSLAQSADPAERPKSYHSVFVWQDGPRAYLVGVGQHRAGRRRHLRHHEPARARADRRLRPRRALPRDRRGRGGQRG